MKNQSEICFSLPLSYYLSEVRMDSGQFNASNDSTIVSPAKVAKFKQLNLSLLLILRVVTDCMGTIEGKKAKP